jgi:hypothetical protein
MSTASLPDYEAIIREYQALADSVERNEKGSQREQSMLPEFPEAAWRGSFEDYRTAMQRASTAPSGMK